MIAWIETHDQFVGDLVACAVSFSIIFRHIIPSGNQAQGAGTYPVLYGVSMAMGVPQ